MDGKLIALAALLLVSGGCRQAPKQAAEKSAAAVQEPSGSRAGTRAAARPSQLLQGRILALRSNLRFVIIDFPNGQMPQLEQKLFAYRLDQRVAELRISGPYRGTTVAADIIAGEPGEGDLVRDR